jgi:hypothetical protein
MTNLQRRFSAAIDAFRQAAPQRYLIVESLAPIGYRIGWHILHEFVDYHDAHLYRSEHYPDRRIRIMVESEWRRRTIDIARGQVPWIAMAKIEAQLALVRSELADERSIGRARLLDTFGQSEHP